LQRARAAAIAAAASGAIPEGSGKAAAAAPAEEGEARLEPDDGENLSRQQSPADSSLVDSEHRSRMGPVRVPTGELFLTPEEMKILEAAEARENNPRPRKKAPLLKRFILSPHFESFICMCILANCATMGFEAHQQVTNEFSQTIVFSLVVLEHLFTLAFTVEFVLRLKVFGYQDFVPTSAERRSNFMDACLVIFTGILFTWVIPLVTFILGVSSTGGFLQTLSVLRAARLARLVRVVQRVPVFREAWMLVRGLSDSARTLFWTCVVIFFVTYVFAIFGLAMVVEPLLRTQQELTDPGDVQIIDDLFQICLGLDRLMYTLIQVLTMDSYHNFMREIMRFLPFSWMYFYAYIAVAVFVLMNLVTAIIVENAVTTSQNDHAYQVQQKESKRQKELAELCELFAFMDADGSGTLSWAEFKESFDDPEMSKKWFLLDFQPEECKELFALLDDGDGEIETKEFFEGLGRMKGSAQSKDVYRLQKSVNKLHGSVDEQLSTLTNGIGPKGRRNRKPLSSPRSPRQSRKDGGGGGGGGHILAALKDGGEATILGG